jgi:hypothetical protein
MADKTRIRIAAAVTALFLAGVSAAGLTFRDHRPQPATPQAIVAPAIPAAPAVQVTDRGEHYDEGERDE